MPVYVREVTNYNKALMDTVEQYAHEKGMDTVSGSLGFLEFDASGVLVDGFDQLPTAYGKYNAPYYDSHFAALDYAKDVDFVEYLIKVPEVIPERYARMAQLVSVKNGLHQAPLTRHSEIEPYLDDLFSCMNDALQLLQLKLYREALCSSCLFLDGDAVLHLI